MTDHDDDAARPQRRGFFRLGLGAVAALAALAPRGAPARAGRAQFRGAALPGRGAYGADVMTQPQLERCVVLEAEINREAEAVEAEEAAVGARREELERSVRDAEGRAARVDRNDPAAVKRLARTVEQQRAAAVDLKERLPASGARARRHAARVAEFEAGCAVNPYYQADMRTVRARLLLD